MEFFKDSDGNSIGKADEFIKGLTIDHLRLFSGWGLTSGGGLFAPNKLQVVEIDIVNQEECNGIFQGYIKPGMICAGEAGAAPCNGDSGGPLVCPDGNGNNKLAGIVSFGENGCTTTGVYTRVSNYEEWISERIVA